MSAPDARERLCDEDHCYCDNPHRCRWNHRDGPQPPRVTDDETGGAR